MSIKDVQIETCHLNNSIAPNLKIKYTGDVDSVTRKHKIVNMRVEQLKKHIKDVTVPTLDNVHTKNIDALMRDVIFEQFFLACMYLLSLTIVLVFFDNLSIRKPKFNFHLINPQKNCLNLNEIGLSDC